MIKNITPLLKKNILKYNIPSRIKTKFHSVIVVHNLQRVFVCAPPPSYEYVVSAAFSDPVSISAGALTGPYHTVGVSPPFVTAATAHTSSPTIATPLFGRRAAIFRSCSCTYQGQRGSTIEAMSRG